MRRTKKGMDKKTQGLGFNHLFFPSSKKEAEVKARGGGGEKEKTLPITLFLLHGTGGNEEDLIPLGNEIAPGAAILSPRGKVLENGMPRFFRRLAEGVFDEEDVRRRADELAGFVAEAREACRLGAPVGLGFSN